MVGRVWVNSLSLITKTILAVKYSYSDVGGKEIKQAHGRAAPIHATAGSSGSGPVFPNMHVGVE